MAQKDRNQNAEVFLSAYRGYESILREHGKDYKQIEEETEGILGGRLRIMRQLRNYLVHNEDPGFIQVSESQIMLLEQLTEKEKMSGDILKLYLCTPKKGAIKEETMLKDVMAKMSKEGKAEMVVYGASGILGVVNLPRIVSLYLKNPERVLNRKTYGPYGKNFQTLLPETPMSGILAEPAQMDIICCTEDGTASGKFLGVLK